MREPQPIEMDVVPTQEGYDRWAQLYDGDDNPLVQLEEQHFGALIGNVAGLAVADIGCGTGRQSVRLAAAGARVTGVDFSEEMLARARAKPAAKVITFVQHDLARTFPFRSASFDRVACCLVLDHIKDLKGFFAELRRICKPDGLVAVSVMHPAMSLVGVQARFIDPASGRRISPAGHAHCMADYLMAALEAGLTLDHVAEYSVDAALAAKSPRSQKYLDWPLLLLMRLAPRADIRPEA